MSACNNCFCCSSDHIDGSGPLEPKPANPDDVVEDASSLVDSVYVPLGFRDDEDAVLESDGGVGKADSSPTNCSRVDRGDRDANGGSM